MQMLETKAWKVARQDGRSVKYPADLPNVAKRPTTQGNVFVYLQGESYGRGLHRLKTKKEERPASHHSYEHLDSIGCASLSLARRLLHTLPPLTNLSSDPRVSNRACSNLYQQAQVALVPAAC